MKIFLDTANLESIKKFNDRSEERREIGRAHV